MKQNIYRSHNLVTLLITVLLLLTIKAEGQADFPAFPPDNVSRSMDRDQMLYQLGITIPELPPKTEDPNAPTYAFPADSSNPNGNWTDAHGSTITRSSWGLWNNYHDKSSGFFPGTDSFRLGSYTPIDLLKMKDGTRITSPDEWWSKRRPEIFKDIQEALYGVIPPDSVLPSVTFTVSESRGGNGNAAYIQKEIRGVIDISRYPEIRNIPVISATLRTPAGATGPVPVMIHFGGGFGGSIDLYWNRMYPNGWGYCVFNLTQLQPDNGEGLTSYLIGLVNKGNWRQPADWGSLVAWSWGVSRIIDYFETDRQVDASKTGLTGHSRYGKATLVTMAYEPRLAIAFPSDAGSLGTKMNRRHWGQDLENSTWVSEYHWMAGNFFKWAGEKVPGQYLPRKIEDCPVDAHSLLALCAPRPVFINGGNRSSWCDPYGMYLTSVYASPVYELLGTKGIVMPDEKPRIDVGYISGGLAYRYHDGGHTDAPEWPDFFEFAVRFIHVPVLETSASSVSLGYKKDNTAEINISSNVDWSISGSETWLSADPASSSLDGVVTIKAEPNSGDTARSAILSIRAKGRQQSIVVNQSSSNPRLSVSGTSFFIDEPSFDTLTVNITSNTAWDVASSEGWLAVKNEAGINNRDLIVYISENPRVEERRAELTISARDIESKTITVTQTKGLPTLFISADSIRLNSAEGSSANIWASSNTDIILESSESWLKTDFNARGRFSSITVTAAANPSDQERSAMVSVKVEGLPIRKILVRQEAD